MIAGLVDEATWGGARREAAVECYPPSFARLALGNGLVSGYRRGGDRK